MWRALGYLAGAIVGGFLADAIDFTWTFTAVSIVTFLSGVADIFLLDGKTKSSVLPEEESEPAETDVLIKRPYDV
jgi:predicted MFS family arabinose efflux permease